jgi:hypothetical protein
MSNPSHPSWFHHPNFCPGNSNFLPVLSVKTILLRVWVRDEAQSSKGCENVLAHHSLGMVTNVRGTGEMVAAGKNQVLQGTSL